MEYLCICRWAFIPLPFRALSAKSKHHHPHQQPPCKNTILQPTSNRRISWSRNDDGVDPLMLNIKRQTKGLACHIKTWPRSVEWNRRGRRMDQEQAVANNNFIESSFGGVWWWFRRWQFRQEQETAGVETYVVSEGERTIGCHHHHHKNNKQQQQWTTAWRRYEGKEENEYVFIFDRNELWFNCFLLRQQSLYVVRVYWHT